MKNDRLKEYLSQKLSHLPPAIQPPHLIKLTVPPLDKKQRIVHFIQSHESHTFKNRRIASTISIKPKVHLLENSRKTISDRKVSLPTSISKVTPVMSRTDAQLTLQVKASRSVISSKERCKKSVQKKVRGREEEEGIRMRQYFEYLMKGERMTQSLLKNLARKNNGQLTFDNTMNYLRQCSKDELQQFFVLQRGPNPPAATRSRVSTTSVGKRGPDIIPSREIELCEWRKDQTEGFIG